MRVDKESWEDVRPKAAVAANVGSGPDMVMSWFDDPQQYPDKLVDVTDLGTSIGAANGGWYPGLESYAKRGDSFIALPLCAIGNAVVYRDSHMKAAGFQEFPKGHGRLPRLCKALKARARPPASRTARRWATATNYATGCSGAMAARWWTRTASHHQQPETLESVKYAMELYKTFIPGTESWQDVNNNRAFLAGQVSLTANGVSVYYAALKDPALKEIAEDMRSVNLPIGPWASRWNCTRLPPSRSSSTPSSRKRPRPISSSCTRPTT